MRVTKAEFEKIVKICERAEKMNIGGADRITLIMDLENTHHSMGLNLDGLLSADDLNFSHDIVGIQKYMNRETKELEDFFVPRYAQQKDVDINAIIDKAQKKSTEYNQSAKPNKDVIEKEQG